MSRERRENMWREKRCGEIIEEMWRENRRDVERE